MKSNPGTDAETILVCKNLWKNFGGMTAVKSLDFKVYKNEIFGISGPNGAGKTTLFIFLYLKNYVIQAVSPQKNAG